MTRMILFSFLLAAAPQVASAQNRPTYTVSLLAGPSSYDLSGTGTTFAAAGEFTWHWLPALVLEPGITYFSYDTQFGGRTTILFPELSLQARVPRGPVRPYVGAGIGLSLSVAGGGGTHRSLHAVAGLGVGALSSWSFRGELRVRSPQQWGAVTADYMFGLSRALR